MKDKVVVCLGDSITEGVGASSVENSYPALLRKREEFSKVYNCGIGGTRITRRKEVSAKHVWDMDFIMRVDYLPENADYVIIFGGTNDYGHGDIPIGKKGDYTEYTFYGAVNILLDKLSTKYGKEKLRFILPLRRCEENRPNRPPLIEWVKVLKEILEEKGIIYLDLYNNGFSKPLNKEESEFFKDGLHPNDNGYKKLEEYIYQFLLKTK